MPARDLDEIDAYCLAFERAAIALGAKVEERRFEWFRRAERHLEMAHPDDPGAMPVVLYRLSCPCGDQHVMSSGAEPFSEEQGRMAAVMAAEKLGKARFHREGRCLDLQRAFDVVFREGGHAAPG
jgi:hypothetical protein